MKPKTISIIGGTGMMGTTFARLFKKDKYKVILATHRTKITPIEAAKQGDIVIITVPIDKTLKVIKQVAPFVKKTALLTDFTSIKVAPVKAMLKYSKAEVIGGHPVFGPTKSIEKQNYVICPARGKSYISWYKRFLKKHGANIIITTPDKHDKEMAVIQCLRHFSTIALGISLKDLKFNLKSSKKYYSPIYQIRMEMLGRLFDEDAELYADILTLNPYSKIVLNRYLKSTKLLYNDVKFKKRNKIAKKFKDTSKFLGEKFNKQSMENTNYLIKQMVKLNKKKKNK
ncbi:prephenate dehydrogenase/arogenate dehydrogenase family protein [Nanoarchaeota archaeon]